MKVSVSVYRKMSVVSLIFMLLIANVVLKTQHIKREEVLNTEILLPVNNLTIQRNYVQELNVYNHNDVVDVQQITLQDTFVAIYLDDVYAFTVRSAVAQSILQYLEVLCNDMLSKQPSAEGVRFSKPISIRRVSSEIDSKYVLTYDEVLERLQQTQLVYKTLEITPNDTIKTLAERLNVSEETVRLLDVTYNNIPLASDWTEHELVVGARLQYPTTVNTLQLYYVTTTIGEVELMPEVEVVYDDTMTEGTMVVDEPGALGLYSVKYTVVKDEDGNIIEKQEVDKKCLRAAVKSIVRVGTKPYYTQSVKSRYSGTYYYPIQEESSYISAYMGDNRGHKGIDIAAPYATPIYAIADGVVTDVGTGWNGGYGNAVVIDNTDGNVSRYAHMSWSIVEEGARVLKGQIIGYVGSTGDSTGNHLHLEVIQDGMYLNPLNYF